MYSPRASQLLDLACIEAGISEQRLIQQASTSASAILREILQDVERQCNMKPRLVFFCGPGNNGADGLTMASMLTSEYEVVVVQPSQDGRRSPGNMQACASLAPQVRKISLHEFAELNLQKHDVIIDALLGCGATLPLRDAIREHTRVVKESRADVVAIDIPTGLDALTGEVDPDGVVCSHSISMAGPKPGMLRGLGRAYCGRVHVADIGAPETLTERMSDGCILDEVDLSMMLPTRTASSSKFDYGHVTVIGGSLGMRGAPSMTAHAAIALGAGMVELLTPSVHPLTPREIMTWTLPHHDDGTISHDSLTIISERLRRATVVALGPGLGSNPRTIAMLSEVIGRLPSHVTLVLDADGLRCLASIDTVGCRLVLTPHMGELARLLGKSREDLAVNYVEHAQALAKRYDAIVHIKHVPPTTVTSSHATYLQRGNAALASAGAGDVLTGIVTSLVAQGMTAYDAARCGAWLHADAADTLVGMYGKTSIMATELIEPAARRRGLLTASRY